MESEELSQYCD